MRNLERTKRLMHDQARARALTTTLTRTDIEFKFFQV